MKRLDIDKIMTQKVAEYLAEGYIINTQSMSGSQGEEGKIDLVKGTTLIRIWLNSESHYRDDNWWGNVLVLRVGKWKYPTSESAHRTVWMSEMELIEAERKDFYEISRGCWYVEELEEAMRIQSIRRDRAEYRYMKSNTQYLTSDAAKFIAKSYLKRKLSYSRVSQDEIRIRKEMYDDRITYIVFYKNRRIRIK